MKQESRWPTPSLAVLVLFLASACADVAVNPESDPIELDLAVPWRTVSVSQVGGSPDLVQRGLARARTNHRLLSLLVVKDGYLVVEEYFRGNGQDSLNDVRSVTKSVVSALTGIVIARGDMSVDDPIAKYLAPTGHRLPPDKQQITVGNLLTMTSGLEWNESGDGNSYAEWILSGDHIGYVLEQPLINPPGSHFNYNSGAVHVLGVVVEQATGMRLPDLADLTLFAPLGITTSRWEPLLDGYFNGGAGLDLRPRDLARLGQLYLQSGSSNGRQVIPARWTNLSSSPSFSWRFDAGNLRGLSYGLLWWVVPEARDPFYFAWGYGGQFIVVVPSLDLVAVATNDWRRVSQDGGAGRYEQETIAVIQDYILPAFR